jgi:hypothetical protein
MKKLQIIYNYPEANNKGSNTAENANVPLLHGIGNPHISLQMRIVTRQLGQTVLFQPPEPGLGPIRLPPASSNTKCNSEAYVLRL